MKTPTSRIVDFSTGETLSVLGRYRGVLAAWEISGYAGVLYDELKKHAMSEMEALVEKHFAGIEHETAVQLGTPYEDIVLYAEETGMDLIVIGSHGRRGLEPSETSRRTCTFSSCDHVAKTFITVSGSATM